MSVALWGTRCVVVNCGIGRSARRPQPPCRAARAALSRAKSSPAWCEERVSGLAETMRKPLA